MAKPSGCKVNDLIFLVVKAKLFKNDIFPYSRVLALATLVSKAKIEGKVVQYCLRINVIQNLVQHKPD